MDGGELTGAVGELIDNRYCLEEAMSGGVTATTWRAHDPILGRDVAIKIWSDASDDAKRSQQDELGAARLLDPNLNELLDAGTHDGRPYLVREIAVEHPVLPASPPSAPVPAPDTDPSLPAVAAGPGSAAASEPRRRDRVVMISVAAVIAAVGLVAVGLVSRPGAQDPPAAERDAEPITPSAVASFDPEGDGNENADDLGAILDGDPSTAWSSHRYKTREFGNLKPGLGLVLEFDTSTSIHELEVLSEEGGWSAEVYGAAEPSAALEGWGPPIDRVSEAGVSERFDLEGRTVGAVLVWFTDIGSRSTRVTITDVQVIGAP